MNKKFYSCESHIDCVIDDFIKIYGLTPNLNFNDFKLNYVYCNYCDKVAKYIVDSIEN